MKKLLSVALVLTMVFTSTPVNVSAANSESKQVSVKEMIDLFDNQLQGKEVNVTLLEEQIENFKKFEVDLMLEYLHLGGASALLIDVIKCGFFRGEKLEALAKGCLLMLIEYFAYEGGIFSKEKLQNALNELRVEYGVKYRKLRRYVRLRFSKVNETTGNGGMSPRTPLPTPSPRSQDGL